MARGKGIYKRGAVWWIRYMDSTGKMKFESSKSTKFTDAEANLLQKRQDIKDGKNTEQAKDIGEAHLRRTSRGIPAEDGK